MEVQRVLWQREELVLSGRRVAVANQRQGCQHGMTSHRNFDSILAVQNRAKKSYKNAIEAKHLHGRWTDEEKVRVDSHVNINNREGDGVALVISGCLGKPHGKLSSFQGSVGVFLWGRKIVLQGQQ